MGDARVARQLDRLVRREVGDEAVHGDGEAGRDVCADGRGHLRLLGLEVVAARAGERGPDRDHRAEAANVADLASLDATLEVL